MTASNLSRRGALGALVAFTAASAIALPAPADTANALWAERQNHVERLARLGTEYSAAHVKLPAWAISGPERIDVDGNPCGAIVGWPLVEDPTPPRIGTRIVRPSIHQAKDQFEFAVSVFGSTPKFRENSRAAMRRSIKAIVARLRERRHLYEDLGLTALDHEMSDAVTAMCKAEDAIGELEQSPNVIAATVLAGLGNDCSRSEFAEGYGYSGTMAMALVALRGLLPNLSGMIRDHAAFFVSNPTLPLSAMPFAPL
jgi:HAMP domain-containing protein